VGYEAMQGLLRLWRRRQQAHPQCRCLFTNQYGVTFQQYLNFTKSTVRISNTVVF